jgi:hypothetical protein
MIGRRGGALWAALVWLAFPAVPVVLENVYNGLQLSFPYAGPLSPDPRDWNWVTWVVEIGPLVGFGFLAGATLGLPDEPAPPGRRRFRGWLSKRSVWVAVGPWSGFLVLSALYWTITTAIAHLPESPPPSTPAPAATATKTWIAEALGWTVVVLVVATLGYGWLVAAWAAVRRGRRVGRAWESTRRGLGVALAFVGSLFGGFWAVTEGFREFFFDTRVVPVLLVALSIGVLMLSGCASPLTYGEVRRRELFHAMLLAWTFGLALLWLWWSRPRKPPRAR